MFEYNVRDCRRARILLCVGGWNEKAINRLSGYEIIMEANKIYEKWSQNFKQLIGINYEGLHNKKNTI